MSIEDDSPSRSNSLHSSGGLIKLFREIREKDKLEDLSVQYKKFAEWLRIEYAVSIVLMVSG